MARAAERGGARRAMLAMLLRLMLLPLVLPAAAARPPASFPSDVNGHSLHPPYFNLAEGTRISATATCGEEAAGAGSRRAVEDLYCKLVGGPVAGGDPNQTIQVRWGRRRRRGWSLAGGALGSEPPFVRPRFSVSRRGRAGRAPLRAFPTHPRLPRAELLQQPRLGQCWGLRGVPGHPPAQARPQQRGRGTHVARSPSQPRRELLRETRLAGFSGHSF